MDSRDLRNLSEAWQRITASDFLSEQTWQEVETWVNSLLEEGYDLSEYTWEDMYEAYLNEDCLLEYGENAGLGYARSPKEIERMGLNKPYVSRFARPRNANTTVRNSATGEVLQKPKMGGINDPKYRGQELQQAARARASQVKPTTPTNPANTGSGTSDGGNLPQTVAASGGAGGRVTVGTKYAATLGGKQGTVTYDASGKKTFTANAPTKPVASDAKPAPTVTNAKDKSAPTSTTAPTAPAAKPLSDVGKMIQASQMRQKGANVTSDMISDKSVKAPAPKPQLSARAQALKAGGPAGGARGRMLNQDLDLFDIVKGHLLDEGYADTEEAALAIMANMSEEWKQSIVEGAVPMPTLKPGKGSVRAVPMPTLKPGKGSVRAVPMPTFPSSRGGGTPVSGTIRRI